ncbi:MAG TPA: phospholipid carrier-dependent glycosyltransferase [Anaerolineales bacterium]|nr:phospholipid carrier-dependent glycosyltransferase [Anaerolineales bacterium]
MWGISKVPFHPDEATNLFMSSDLETMFTQPGQLGFDPAKLDDQAQIYRTLDAPLRRYILGLGRLAFGLPALPLDWDWGKTWDENEAVGALPSQELLFAGRLAMTLLLPFSMILIYIIELEMGGQWSGWTSTLLLGLNALALLHGRRAMAEGVLIFGVLLAFWSFLRGGKYPWLAGLGMAIAFNAKQSALALLPVGMLAVVWVKKHRTQISQKNTNSNPISVGFQRYLHDNFWQAGNNLMQFLVVFGLVTFALNPVYWRNPLEATQASLVEREDLLSRQVADAQKFAPEQVLDTPIKRLAVTLGNLYILPLQFYEVGNYQVQTADMEQAYLSVPGHAFLHGFAGGGILLTLTLIGMMRGFMDIRRRGLTRPLVLLFAATGLMGVALLVAVPLPFQRYPIPLLPLMVLWMGMAMKRGK